MKIKIEFKDIVKLQKLYIEIYEEEDQDYPDGRIIRNKEKAVQRILDKITNDNYSQRQIWYIIQTKSWDQTDYSYKPICDELRKLNYIILK